MKIFTFVAVAFALASVVLINRHFSQDNIKYADRLANIAKQVNSANASWKAAEYKDFDHFTLEKAKRLNSLIITPPPAHWKQQVFTEEQIQAAPATFDARTQWPNCPSISLIRDQSDCGSCWAFGAAEAMSDRICIGTKGLKKTLVSAANLVSCCLICGQGCDGGFLYPTWEQWQALGIVSGGNYGDNTTCQPYPFAPCAHHTTSTKYPPCPKDEYPTPKCALNCTKESGLHYLSDKTFASSVYNVLGAPHMMTEISTNGPIEAAFTVYEDFLTYQSGVYHHVTGDALGGHAIRILGYGVENGIPYWLCANSWNETWGDNGYFKIKRGTNECGIEGDNYAGLSK